MFFWEISYVRKILPKTSSDNKWACCSRGRPDWSTAKVGELLLSLLLFFNEDVTKFRLVRYVKGSSIPREVTSSRLR